MECELKDPCGLSSLHYFIQDLRKRHLRSTSLAKDADVQLSICATGHWALRTLIPHLPPMPRPFLSCTEASPNLAQGLSCPSQRPLLSCSRLALRPLLSCPEASPVLLKASPVLPRGLPCLAQGLSCPAPRPPLSCSRLAPKPPLTCLRPVPRPLLCSARPALRMLLLHLLSPLKTSCPPSLSKTECSVSSETPCGSTCPLSRPCCLHHAT